MSVVKNVNIEYGRDYSISTVTMSDGTFARVICTASPSGDVTRVSESDAGEEMEDFAQRIVMSISDAMLDMIAGGS